jgi:hypothetical protein
MMIEEFHKILIAKYLQITITTINLIYLFKRTIIIPFLSNTFAKILKNKGLVITTRPLFKLLCHKIQSNLTLSVTPFQLSVLKGLAGYPSVLKRFASSGASDQAYRTAVGFIPFG